MNRKILTETIKYIAVFLGTAAVLVLLLAGSALIPRSAVRDNMLSSAEYFCGHRMFCQRLTGSDATITDNYADCITTAIAWGFDETKPLESVMRCSFYHDGVRNVDKCFLDGITKNIEPYTEYMRYWHGSAAVTRIMHLFTDISGMRTAAAVLIYTLTAALLLVLVLIKKYTEAVCALISLACVSLWFVADTIQNVWCVVIMLAVSVVCVLFAKNEKYESISTVMLISGIVTAFFDFLTTETMTVLFPLLLVLSMKRREGGKLKDDALWCVKCCALWLCGFALMWALKWLMAAVILGIDVMPFVTGHISERLSDREGAALIPYIAELLARNICCLFPLGYNEPGLISGLIAAVGMCFYIFVFRVKGADRGAMILFAALGSVVFVRYLILLNHSHGHFFFTYRAQVSSVLALLLISTEITSIRAGRKTAAALSGSEERKKTPRKKQHGKKT